MEDLYKKITELFNQHHHIAHDIKHVTRVAALAKYIANQEGYDINEAEVASMLHDIGRTVQKEEKGHGPAGVPLARQLLVTYTDYNEATKIRILSAVEHHSELNTVGKLTHIIQDADMLDGLGAVGIMRTYTSKANSPDYNPDNIIPTVGKRDANIHDIHNIHDQMAFQLRWLGLMHTSTAKKLATKRCAFMMKFLEEFRDEVQGHDF